jgi:DNA polymerase-1
MEKWIVIDGNSIANRAFYALPPLSNSQGLHTNAIYGFTTMLLRLIDEEKPSHLAVVFDAGKINFRHSQYANYKGGRAKTPPELSEQFPVLKQLLQAMGVAQLELEGYEADDIIGTLSKHADERQTALTIVSGDKDMLQLVSDHVTVGLTKKGISEMLKYTPAVLHEQYGLQPKQIIDLKGLMGDTSDNIPGVPGVGEKTALKLLYDYETVEGVLANVAALKGKLKENIENHVEDAKMSKELATIFCEVPMAITEEQLTFTGIQTAAAGEMFRKLEFKSLVEKFAGDTPVEPEMDAIGFEWKSIQTDSEFAPLAATLQDEVALFVEVIGENPHQATIAGIALSSSNQQTYIEGKWLTDPAFAPIKGWLEDASAKKATYDAHKAAVALHWQAGIQLAGVSVDAMLAGYLLDSTDVDLSLSGLVQHHLQAGLAQDEQVYGKGAKFNLPEQDVLGAHLCRKAEKIGRLVTVLEQKLTALNMRDLYYELELPLAAILTKMEVQGIKVQAEDLHKLGEHLQQSIQTLEQNIYEQAGTTFNLNSPKQLGEILFDKLQLPVIKKTKTGYSTDAEVLDKLAHRNPIVSDILTYRQLAKLQSTYIEGLLKEIRPETGKIHTYYRQTIAATGRLSSQFPNLQNIPIRLEEGRQIRKAFVPSEAGWSIVAADYSQIELRVLAHICGDEKLIEAFQQNKDIHTKTAMDVFGVAEDQVDAHMRRSAKAVNFGIVYGISDYGLSQNLDITRKEAAQFIEQYFAVFGGVRRFMDDVVKQAKMDGYVSTLLHRRRYLPEINSSNFNLRSFAERTAMNTPIQGTAADIIKVAMVHMDRELQARGLKSRMLLQVHDELVFEVPADELETMKTLVPTVMSEAVDMIVPLKAEVSVGSNWYEAK